MQIGINIYTKWPYRQIIDAFAENGIRHTFVCADHPQLDEVMGALKAANITVDNIHAPYKGQNGMWSEDEQEQAMLHTLMESVDICVRHGVKLMVAHVSNGRPMPPVNEAGIARFDRLLAYAKAQGVQVAFESHRYAENVEFMLRRHPEVGFCLDTAHEHAFTPGKRYMPEWGSRLAATHLSDNDCLCDKDMHMLPFDGIIDFDQTAREIAACGRDVTLMLEIKPENHERYRDVPLREYYRAAAERLRRFEQMVEGYKAR